jgi:hypothetical protein
MCEKGTATSDQRRQLDLEYQDWAARLSLRGPARTAHSVQAAMGPPAAGATMWAGRSSRRLNCEDQRGT